VLRYILIASIILSATSLTTQANNEETPERPSGINKAPLDSDGRFTNLGGTLEHGSLSVRVPFILRRFGTYFRSGEDAPSRIDNDGLLLRENTDLGMPTVTWIGHATVLVQMQGITFLTDPTWSNRPSPVPMIGPRRFVEPGLDFDDLPPIDFVVISHNHYDHLDLPTLKRLAKRQPETVFFVPLGNAALLQKNQISNVKALDWGERIRFKEVVIHCLPAQHWSKRSLADDRRTLWSSWAVTGADRRFYFAGDTGYFPEFKTIGDALGPFDLVAMPIGAYAPRAMMKQSHMNPEEAIQAALDLNAKQTLGIHFGTFDLSDEPLSEPPRRFKAAAKNNQLDLNQAWIFDIGETRGF